MHNLTVQSCCAKYANLSVDNYVQCRVAYVNFSVKTFMFKGMTCCGISYLMGTQIDRCINYIEMKQNVNANNIWCSQAVTHPSTNQTLRCLTSLIGREAVHSTWYGRWQSLSDNLNKLFTFLMAA